MSSEWPKCTIGDLVKSGQAFIQTGPFGSQLHKCDYLDDGVAVIPTEAIGRGRILDIEVPKISKTKADELARHRLSAGDILFARRGAQATGLSAIVDQRYVGALCGTGALLLRVKSANVDPHYLSIYLSSEFAFDWLRTHAVGAVMPNLNTAIIGALPLILPTISEQKELSLFLGALDDRITLLRETNATLEAIAQALFKSWFVDFDPVRAKMEGRAPEGMDEATATLFPDSFEEPELGLVPRGWRVGNVGTIANVIDCLHSKKPELIDAGKPFLQLNNIRNDGLLDTSEVAGISNQEYGKWISRIEVSTGDCVITNVGRVGAVAQIPSGFKAAMGRNMTAIRLHPSWPYPTYLIELLQSKWMRSEIENKTDTGTILNALNVKNIPLLRCFLATSDVMKAFEDVSRPLRAGMEENIKSANTLATLRDTLLPRLISGQLRLPEAQSQLEEAYS
jgi:type I restriction enzyme S subunit